MLRGDRAKDTQPNTPAPDVWSPVRKMPSAAVGPGRASVCSLLRNAAVDLTLHNALRVVMEGKVVIKIFHSSSELASPLQRMQPAVEMELKKVEGLGHWALGRPSPGERGGCGPVQDMLRVAVGRHHPADDIKECEERDQITNDIESSVQ